MEIKKLHQDLIGGAISLAVASRFLQGRNIGYYMLGSAGVYALTGMWYSKMYEKLSKRQLTKSQLNCYPFIFSIPVRALSRFLAHYSLQEPVAKFMEHLGYNEAITRMLVASTLEVSALVNINNSMVVDRGVAIQHSKVCGDLLFKVVEQAALHYFEPKIENAHKILLVSLLARVSCNLALRMMSDTKEADKSKPMVAIYGELLSRSVIDTITVTGAYAVSESYNLTLGNLFGKCVVESVVRAGITTAGQLGNDALFRA